MSGKKFRMAIAALCMLAIAAVWLEVTGYAAIGRTGAGVLCDIDPACRPLTPGEAIAARSIFGDEVDYGAVKIFRRPNYLTAGIRHLFAQSSSAEAPNGSIYYKKLTLYSADLSDSSVFIHEMTHIWQKQNGQNLPVRALNAFIAAGYDYGATYDYSETDGRPFASLGIEQQAEMVQDYWKLRMRHARDENKPAWVEKHCPKVRELESRIGEELPVTHLGACLKPASTS